MNHEEKRSGHFKDYFERGNDRKRLTGVLLLFAILVCPVFALLFHVIGAPESFRNIILSGTVIFPAIILLERYVKPLNGKLPVLYFVYFLVCIFYIGYDLKEHNFSTYHFAFFTGMFATLIAGLQRFWFSLVFKFMTLCVLLLLYLQVEKPEMKMLPGMVLIMAVGAFYCVMYYSRDKMIRGIQDYSDYLKLIINNPGNGVALMQMNGDKLELADFNQEALRILNVNGKEALEQKLSGMFPVNENNDAGNNYQLRIRESEDEQIIDVKVIPLSLKTGNYLLATIMDVTQQIRKQGELSREMLRAELAEESNKMLAREIEERIRIERRLQEEILRTKAIYDSSSNTLLLTLNPELRFSSFNSHCRQYFEWQTSQEFKENLQFEAYFKSLFPPVYLRYFSILMQQVKKGKSFQIEISFTNRKEQNIWLDTFINPIFDTNGNVSEISLVCHDISEKKLNEKEIIQSLKEKEVLLKEVHHRVKNNLQVISSILSLQSNYTQDEKILEILSESKDRVRSMAIIHENLYRTNNFSSINFSTYVKELAHNLIASYQFNKNVKIHLEFKISEVELNLDQAIPCGLVINEIITNSIKYAFSDKKEGIISLVMKEEDGRIFIEVGDNGIGFSKKPGHLDSDSLGIQLIITLIEQLEGNIKLDNSQGIKYLINFEKEKN